jgi:hypothetical protein
MLSRIQSASKFEELCFCDALKRGMRDELVPNFRTPENKARQPS